MPKSNDESQPNYPLEAQNAIFNFLFILANEYAKEMPYEDAIVKACDWNISLSQHVKKQATEFKQELLDKQNNFINPDK